MLTISIRKIHILKKVGRFMQLFRKKLLKLSLFYLIITIIMVIYIQFCQIGLGVPCLFNKYLNVNCIACGATRAGMAILKFDIFSAIKYNALFTLVIYPIFIFCFVQHYICAVLSFVRKKEYKSIVDKIFP